MNQSLKELLIPFKYIYTLLKYPIIRNKNASWALRIFFVAIIVIIFSSLIIHSYLNPSTQAQKQNYVKIILQMIGGLIVFFGAFVAWQRVEVNRESQVTDRFIRANEQLGAVDQDGNPKIETRLGGIYALERLARERKDYHWTIMEILTAYVKKNSPRKKDDETDFHLSTDIPTIIKVVGRREWKNEEPQKNIIDLSKTNLSFCNFSKGYFYEALFSAANLSRANLSDAYLTGADLADANLSGADLADANLSEALLPDAFLSKAELSDAYLTGADLADANLSGALLPDVNFSGSFIPGGNLSDTFLPRADLSDAYLAGADLSGADLSKADLSGANLSGAKLSNSKNLAQEQINHAYGDETTKLPDHIERPAHWKDDETESSKGSQDSGAT